MLQLLELGFWLVVALSASIALLKLQPRDPVSSTCVSDDRSPLLLNESNVKRMSNDSLIETFESIVTLSGKTKNVEPGLSFIRNEINKRLTKSL